MLTFFTADVDDSRDGSISDFRECLFDSDTGIQRSGIKCDKTDMLFDSQRCVYCYNMRVNMRFIDMPNRFLQVDGMYRFF